MNNPNMAIIYGYIGIVLERASNGELDPEVGIGIKAINVVSNCVMAEDVVLLREGEGRERRGRGREKVHNLEV